MITGNEMKQVQQVLTLKTAGYISSDSSPHPPLFSPQWDGAVRMWEHRQTHPLEEERERERD